MYVNNSLNPIERKSMATRTMELIQVDINPKNTTHVKLVLVYRNTTITAADDDAFYATLEEILLTQHECVIMGDFNKQGCTVTLLLHYYCYTITPSHYCYTICYTITITTTISHSAVMTSQSAIMTSGV